MWCHISPHRLQAALAARGWPLLLSTAPCRATPTRGSFNSSIITIIDPDTVHSVAGYDVSVPSRPRDGCPAAHRLAPDTITDGINVTDVHSAAPGRNDAQSPPGGALLPLNRTQAAPPPPSRRGNARCQSGRSRKRAAVSLRRVRGFLLLRLRVACRIVGGAVSPCSPKQSHGASASRTNGHGGQRGGTERLGSSRLLLPPLRWKNPDGGPQCALSLPQASGPDSRSSPGIWTDSPAVWVSPCGRSRLEGHLVTGAAGGEMVSAARAFSGFTRVTAVFISETAPPLRRLQGLKTNSSS